MILVDDAGKSFPEINHSPWFGVTLADFVMPFFLFVVGTSVSLVFKVWDIIFPKQNFRAVDATFVCSQDEPNLFFPFTQKVPNKTAATRKVVMRSIKLFLLGLILQGLSTCYLKLVTYL